MSSYPLSVLISALRWGRQVRWITGAVYHFSKDLHFFIDAYFESMAENRPEGERINVRLAYHF